MYILGGGGKGSTWKWNGAKVFIQEDEQMKKWTKGSGDIRVRLSPAKLLSCEKELKNRCGGEGL